jgi:hypothetical protein
MDDDDNLIWRQNYEGYSQAAAASKVYYTPLRQSALQLIKGTVEMHFMGQSDKN